MRRAINTIAYGQRTGLGNINFTIVQIQVKQMIKVEEDKIMDQCN